MAADVGGAKKLFWTLVNNWKKDKNAELTLKSEKGHMFVNYSGDLGVWVPPAPRPPSDPVSKGHQVQGPRKGIGPSRQRRRERRAAERAAATVTEEATSEKGVSNSVKDTTEKVDNATEKGNNVVTEKVTSVKATGKGTFEKCHAEEVQTEKTVTVSSNVRFECDECIYTNDSEKGLKQHKRMKHRISQIDGADDQEISEHEITVNSAEEIRKLLVSFEHNDDPEINEPEINGNSAEEVRKLLVSLGL